MADILTVADNCCMKVQESASDICQGQNVSELPDAHSNGTRTAPISRLTTIALSPCCCQDSRKLTPNLVPGAMHRLPDEARANHLNPGLVTHTGFIHGRCASQRMGPVAAGPVLHKQQRRLLRGVTNHHQRCWSTQAQLLCLSDRCMRLEHVWFWIV